MNFNLRSQELFYFPFHVVRSGNILMGMDLFDALGFRISTPETESTIAPGLRRAMFEASSQFEIQRSIQSTQRSVIVSTGEVGMH